MTFRAASREVNYCATESSESLFTCIVALRQCGQQLRVLICVYVRPSVRTFIKSQPS